MNYFFRNHCPLSRNALRYNLIIRRLTSEMLLRENIYQGYLYASIEIR